MTDRELLELAAKTAGIEHTGVAYHRISTEAIIGLYLLDGTVWNPLTDDGDALRLAVKLKMRLEIADYYAIALHPLIGISCRENATMGYGIEKATRRAIVRAAAEIGKGM